MFSYCTKDRNLVTDSELFDSQWYVSKYRDVSLLGSDPAVHYLTIGWRLGRDPCEKFSTDHYLLEYQDIAESGINPLVHYLTHGKNEGRAILPSYPALSTQGRCERSDHGRRILFHTHNLKWQGAPNSLFEIAKGVNAFPDHESVLVATGEESLLASYKSENIDCDIVPFPSRGLDDANKMSHYFNKMADAYGSHKVDIVHANTGLPRVS